LEFTSKHGQYYHRDNLIEESAAREEGFFASICLCLCPTIGWCQFITIISIVEIVVFIAECSIRGVNNSEFLAPDAHSMEMMGWQDSKKIKNDYQLWRWFTPVLLHGHFEHLFGNLAGQLYMGAGIENGIGPGYMAFLYTITGFGGNLLSSVLNPVSFGVGASTAVFGLVGFYV
jgi:membrane associated rhomboid family serine protease